MRLKNILIVVKDIELSKSFYKDLFGLFVMADFGSNVMLTEGLVLQDKIIWETITGKEVLLQNHAVELYFEENDMDSFMNMLCNCPYDIQYVTPLMKNELGQRVMRIYDPDGHVIEIKEVRQGRDSVK